MNDNKDLFSLVESYLNGGLSEEDTHAFEQKLATDAHLQQQVEVSRVAQAALKRRKLYAIKNLTESVHLKETKSLKTKQIAIGMAGLALLLAGGAYVLLWEKKESSYIQTPVLPKVQTEQAISSPKEPATTQLDAKTEKTAAFPKVSPQTTAAPAIEPIEKPSLPVSVYESKELPAQPITKAAPASPAVELMTKVAGGKPLPDPCAHVTLEAFVMTESACLSEQNGRITVSGFKGGQAPYHSKIFDESSQEVSSVRLGSGVYTALISDQHNCSKKLAGIVVKEIECKKDFELNAGNGDVIELETAPKSGHLTLYDKGGNLYFQKEFAQGEKVLWNGASSHGEQLTGYFLFQLNYSDGKMRRGSVTVTR